MDESVNRSPAVLRLGTRGSLLARLQSEQVASELRRLHPGLVVELHIIKTTGDRIVDRQLHDMGGKGLFTKEIEQALLSGEIDFAVHSYKDVPVTMPLVDVSDLVIAAVPTREDARDVLVAGPTVRLIADLPRGSTVGTGSLRRECQLLNARPDLKIIPIRGNIDTRLKKQTTGKMNAVVLAAAGLIRASLFNATTMIALPIETMVPSAGQGALALQCRASDESTRRLLSAMNDAATERCVNLEREVIQLLNADCHSPIGVYAQMIGTEEVNIRISIGTEGSREVENKSITSSLATASAKLATLLGA